MFVIIGIVVVFGAVVAGYLMEHGNLRVLMQPAELVIIAGAAAHAREWDWRKPSHSGAGICRPETARQEGSDGSRQSKNLAYRAVSE